MTGTSSQGSLCLQCRLLTVVLGGSEDQRPAELTTQVNNTVRAARAVRASAHEESPVWPRGHTRHLPLWGWGALCASRVPVRATLGGPGEMAWALISKHQKPTPAEYHALSLEEPLRRGWAQVSAAGSPWVTHSRVCPELLPIRAWLPWTSPPPTDAVCSDRHSWPSGHLVL